MQTSFTWQLLDRVAVCLESGADATNVEPIIGTLRARVSEMQAG